MNAPDKPFPFDEAIAAAAERIEHKVIAWRRDIHQNPELGNREFRTSKIIAAHLRSLGAIEVCADHPPRLHAAGNADPRVGAGPQPALLPGRKMPEARGEGAVRAGLDWLASR